MTYFGPVRMPEGAGIGVQGVVNARGMFLAIGGNLANLERIAPDIFAVLNEAYEEKFDRWNGFMVETGATRLAWTNDDAPGALREVHADSYEFGSRIEYNRYHRGKLLHYDPSVPTRVADAFIDNVAPQSENHPTYRGFGQGGIASKIRAWLKRDTGVDDREQ